MADEMDMALHSARIGARGVKVTYEAKLESLPNGCFVQLDKRAHLVWDNSLLVWTPEGYSTRENRRKDLTVLVLTPEPFVECFRQGYRPVIHESGRHLMSAAAASLPY
jgi:hypothetical protein